jgi:hypothetical protein
MFFIFTMELECPLVYFSHWKRCKRNRKEINFSVHLMPSYRIYSEKYPILGRWYLGQPNIFSTFQLNAEVGESFKLQSNTKTCAWVGGIRFFWVSDVPLFTEKNLNIKNRRDEAVSCPYCEETYTPETRRDVLHHHHWGHYVDYSSKQRVSVTCAIFVYLSHLCVQYRRNSDGNYNHFMYLGG